MNTKICPVCQAPIPAHAPGGFCPACILRYADEPVPAGRAAPSLADVSAAFPQLEVQALIGQGGMGFVYKVRQPSLDRVVALKILSPELGRDPAFAERFAREARVLGKLNHPNIVTVFEHGESGGFFYLLMEFVDGVNLRQAMRAGRFTPQQALAVVPGICDALQAAHAQGVWHRDIKPENILLDARGGVKIADFGIARIVGDPGRDFTLTSTGAALGSVSYMAPEQHEKPHEVDHRADIYSLGVVIYEMLTGELPLGRFPLPSQRTAVDARIDEIVLKTLEKERSLRQQSATEVKTQISHALQPGQVSATSPAMPKKSGVSSATAKVALGLLLGAVLGLPLLLIFGVKFPLSLSIVTSALALCLILAILSWSESLGRFLAVTSGLVLLAIGTRLAIWNDTEPPSKIMRATNFFFGSTASITRSVGSKGDQISHDTPSEASMTSGRPDGIDKPTAPQTAPEYDFSTPKKAAESMIKAAKKGDEAAFKRGISNKFLERMTAEKADLSKLMNAFSSLIVTDQGTNEGGSATVVTHKEATNHVMTIPLILENNEWKTYLPGKP